MNYNFSGLKVLVVDDNDFMHSIVRDILFAMRIKDITDVHDGASAMREIQTSPPDIVMLDLLMAPTDGFELLKRIRAHAEDEVRHLPVLVMTSYSSMVHVKRARDMGANEIVCKPISVAALVDRFVHMRNSPRQFVKTEMYVGPDRRRTLRGFEGMDKRAGTAGTGDKNGE